MLCEKAFSLKFVAINSIYENIFNWSCSEVLHTTDLVNDN